jgi:hypothetical protein
MGACLIQVAELTTSLTAPPAGRLPAFCENCARPRRPQSHRTGSTGVRRNLILSSSRTSRSLTGPPWQTPMNDHTLQTSDPVGQFIREQIPPVELALASPACRHTPLCEGETGIQVSNSGGIYDDECLRHTPINWNYGNWHRIPAHDELDDPNAPVIDLGHPIRVHDRIRRKPSLFERILAPLKFWPDSDHCNVPDYLRRQDD